jgi:drug/metabolite transporter (DMT)-like permease
MNLTERQKGIVFIVLSALGFSFFPTITRSIYNVSDLQPTDVGTWRFVLASLILWGIILVRSRGKNIQRPMPWLHLLALGILYALSAMSAFVGLQYINGSLYVVLFYTYPAMVAIFSAFMGVRLLPIAWVALGMTLIGVVLTIPDLSLLQQGGNWIGVALAFCNALFVAFYYLASQRYMRHITDITQGTAWMMSATLVVILCATPFTGLNLPSNLPTVALLLVLAVFATVIPIFGLNAGLQRIPAAQASIISSIEPVIAMVIAMLALGEIILPLQWVGAAFIVAAVILLEATPKAKSEPIMQTES